MSETTPQIDDEVRDVLRELVVEIGAISARVVVEHNDDESPERTGVPARTIVLGGGEYLRVELPTRTEKTVDIEAAFDRATRSLRAIRRRWEVVHLPEITVGPNTPPPRDRVIERITTFLQALSSIDRAKNAYLVLRGKLVASAQVPEEYERTRWPFLARRVLGTHAPNSSHGEIVDPDAYAMSFWYDAAIVILLAEPFATDFVRHRCRQVARELVHLLPLLEPDPSAPAMLRNRPPTGPQ